MSILDNLGLVTDRTAEDVRLKNAKGTYNAADTCFKKCNISKELSYRCRETIDFGAVISDYNTRNDESADNGYELQ